MSRTIRGLVLALAVALTATAPAHASLKTRYAALHHQAVKKYGKASVGLNIKRDGVKGRHGWRPAKYPELARGIRNLRAMLRPAPVVRLLVPGSPRREPGGTSTMRAGGTLAAIRGCESGGNYSTNTGNGFYGAYQFTQSTWASVGGTGNPAAASPAEQDRRAAILYAREGAGPWPVCGR